ncbi:MAG: hypothetical protein ACFCBV_02995 [Phycisphaerales bacterium]
MPEPITTADLWDFARESVKDKGSEWEGALDAIGLLHDADFPPYDATPLNCRVFATTGGNGTHFAALDTPGEPIVMVVPMAFDRPHIVVGESLREFLCLGCECGYFGLEQLVYDWTGTIEWINDPESSHQYPEELRLLGELRRRFELEPLADPHGRLKELQRQYRSCIVARTENGQK